MPVRSSISARCCVTARAAPPAPSGCARAWSSLTAAAPRHSSKLPRRSCAWPARAPRRIALSGRESLTPSERRVSQLAAEGLTNKEIAQALFVTLRTVEMHLSNGYRKLGIASRRQLAVALGADRPASK